MNIEVEKNDIWKTGRGGWYDEGGFLAIECNVDTVNYDHILLRSILKCYGEDYTVTNVLEHICKEDEDMIDGYTLVTNLPFEMFEQKNI